MVKISLLRSAALAALAIAGVFATPAQAQRQERGVDVDRTEMRQQRQERREARAEQRAQAAPEARPAPEARQARVEARAARQAERAQAAPQQRNAPEGGWRSQRAGDGQRYGRNWDNNGAVGRPAPAWRGATPQAPERGEARDAARTERNRAYAGDRNRTYRDGNHDGRRWDNRQDRTDNRTDNRDAYRSGYRNGTRADNYRDRRDQSYAYRQGYNSGTRDYRRWDRNDWRRDRRYDWSGYRSHNRSLFSIGRYYSPYRNYSYRRLSIGFFLDSGFYGNRYWINDPWQYRLPEVYGPYRWVRYYDDVLLVDIYTGEVVDVIRDFFW